MALISGPGDASVPLASVVIPSYNRAAQLRACLSGLAAQTMAPRSFEVIVVLDGSSDGSAEMLHGLATPYHLVVLRQENQGQHVARNRGACAASAEHLIFLDDDVSPAPNLVSAHLEAQERLGGVLGIGQIPADLPPRADWYARGFADVMTRHYAKLGEGHRVPSWIDCYGGNFSVPREAFFKVGGFATDLLPSEDIELGFRLEHAGLRVVYLPDAVARHQESKGFRLLAADAERHGGAAVELWRRHPPTAQPLFDSFHYAGPRVMLLRRLLLGLRVPTSWVPVLRRVLGWRVSPGRWFQFARDYCYWRGVRRAVGDRTTWRLLTQGTRILMYHAFGAPGEPASRYILPVGRFALQMTILKLARFRVIPLEELIRFRREHRPPPARAIVITIDDGYRDVHRLACPVLARRGFPATLFAVSHRAGDVNRWDLTGELAGRPLMSLAELRELRQTSIEIGAHTRTHPHLPTLADGAAREEIAGSREDLERELGAGVAVFAYPYGESSQRVSSLAAEAGYLASCGVERGMNTAFTPMHELRRTEIFGTDTLTRFCRKAFFGR